jgi:hypothetical protein
MMGKPSQGFIVRLLIKHLKKFPHVFGVHIICTNKG